MSGSEGFGEDATETDRNRRKIGGGFETRPYVLCLIDVWPHILVI